MTHYLNYKSTTLALAIAVVLSGCGSGSSGPSASAAGAFLRSSVPFYTPQFIDTYVPTAGGDFRLVIDDIFVRDLNRNGVDEIVLAGRLTQPADFSTWKDYNLQIYGWNQGSFANETQTWFAGISNQVVGTEPAVKFADFNGNGHIDMLVSHSTDMELYGPTAVFLNTGSGNFTRQDLDLGKIWSHDAAVADFNKDGISDFFVTDYSGKAAIVMGSTDNQFDVIKSTNLSTTSWSSSVAVADYLGNGSTTIVLTDTQPTGNQDTKLFSWSKSGDELVMTEIAALPASRFHLPKWKEVKDKSVWAPHEIRSVTMDFNNDGLPDVVVFSTMHPQGAIFAYNEVQFLQNSGSGVFEDVTDSILVDFDTSRAATYNPVIVDVNNDGLSDIMMSARSFVEGQEFASVLVQTSDGKFVNSFQNVFMEFGNQITAATPGANGTPPMIAIATGPDNEKYLVSTLAIREDGISKNAVYLAKLGTSGTVTAPALASTVQQAWPWMSEAEVNAVLAQTSLMSIGGIPVIDVNSALSPVGTIGMALNGRHGAVRPITGYIAGVNLKSEHMIMSVVDELKRDFKVNLSSMSVNSFNHWTQTDVQRDNYSAANLSHAQGLVGTNVWEVNGYRMAQNPHSANMFTIGTPGIKLTENFSIHSQLTSLNFSPWVQMSGVWGQVENTLITELGGSYRKNSFVFSAGLMYAITKIESGLVQNINDIVSVWSEVGYQDRESGLSAFVGIKPWALTGSVDVKLPTGIDQNGNMQYQNISAPIQNDIESYLRIGYTKKLTRQLSASVGGIVFASGTYGIMGSVTIAF